MQGVVYNNTGSVRVGGGSHGEATHWVAGELGVVSELGGALGRCSAQRCWHAGMESRLGHCTGGCSSQIPRVVHEIIWQQAARGSRL